jgi:hypothetical protein
MISPGTYDITCWQGATYDKTFTITEAGVALNLTGYTSAMQVRSAADATAIYNTNAGNVGIGTSTTTYRTNIVYTNSAGGIAETGLYLRNTATGNSTQIQLDGNRSFSLLVQGSFGSPAGGFTIQDNTAGASRLSIDANGNVLLGTSVALADNAAVNAKVFRATDSYVLGSHRDGTGALPHNYFFNTNGLCGKIETSGSNTSYITSSDYRLKENIAPMTGALATVSALKPVTYKWKIDGSDGQGFIAHELAKVCPDAVSGEKDAVDAEGNPVYQGIDTSFLVATLTAAIQEQQTLIKNLTTRLNALEGK